MNIDRNDTYNTVVTVVAEKLNIDKSSINGGSSLQDLGADSLDMVEIFMKLEEKFSVQMDDEKAEQLNSIDDVVNYMHGLRGQ